MSNCKHKRSDRCKPGDTFALRQADSPLCPVLAECVRCVDCGAWLSLGESDDAPEDVRTEIEAVRLAMHRVHNDWPDHEPKNSLGDRGWAAYELGTEVPDGAWHGWLANHIVYEYEGTSL